MNAVAVSIAREYCEVGCRFASIAGFQMKRETLPNGVRFLIRFPAGQVIAGEPRPDPRHALVAACKLLPF